MARLMSWASKHLIYISRTFPFTADMGGPCLRPLPGRADEQIRWRYQEVPRRPGPRHQGPGAAQDQGMEGEEAWHIFLDINSHTGGVTITTTTTNTTSRLGILTSEWFDPNAAADLLVPSLLSFVTLLWRLKGLPIVAFNRDESRPPYSSLFCFTMKKHWHSETYKLLHKIERWTETTIRFSGFSV